MSYNGNRRGEVALYRMRLGHTGLNGTGMCNGGMVQETVEHVLLFCEMYDVVWERLFNRLLFWVWVMGVVRFVGNCFILLEIQG